jgi:UDP-N-acetylmuramoylalanine--D-glutamate ligase
MSAAVGFAHKQIALFGLGGSGMATARALIEGGADVCVWDDTPSSRAKAQALGLTLCDLRDYDWARCHNLVLAPGVPLTHPEPHWVVRLAQQAGVEIIGDIEIFCRLRKILAPNAPFVAITGTNGKSTTTALIAHCLRRAGYAVHMGGNIGTPILDLPPPSADAVHVVECSSFQIDLTPSLQPTVGVLLNVTPDHLDRHGTMENYAAVKERLVEGSVRAVIGVDDEYCRAIAARASMRGQDVALISIHGAPHTVHADESGTIYDRDGHVVDLRLEGLPTLRGMHNAQNALAALEVLRHAPFALSLARIADGFATYPGLPHRMEDVGHRGRVMFINDSKATNADAAEKALLSFHDIYWILGGKAKEGGIEPLRPLFSRIRKAYLIGEASEDFARTIGSVMPVERCGTLEVATQSAARDALAAQHEGAPIVLLSPACASYDQFANFEMRGRAFRDYVQALPDVMREG